MKALVVGNTTIDIICPLRRPLGNEMFGTQIELEEGITTSVGGNGAISSMVLAHLGIKTALVTSIGADLLGKMALNILKEKHVRVYNCGSDTAKTVSILNENGDRALLHDPVGEASITTEDVLESINFVRPDILFVTSYFMLPSLGPEEVEEILSTAKRIGIKTFLDTSYDTHGIWDIGSVVDYLDVFFCNEVEAKNLSLKEIAEKCTLVIKKGEKGAEMYHDGKIYRANAPNISVVDATGAGDVFCGAFITGYSKDWDRQMVLQNAVEFASSSVTTYGAVKFLD